MRTFGFFVLSYVGWMSPLTSAHTGLSPTSGLGHVYYCFKPFLRPRVLCTVCGKYSEIEFVSQSEWHIFLFIQKCSGYLPTGCFIGNPLKTITTTNTAWKKRRQVLKGHKVTLCVADFHFYFHFLLAFMFFGGGCVCKLCHLCKMTIFHIDQLRNISFDALKSHIEQWQNHRSVTWYCMLFLSCVLQKPI